MIKESKAITMIALIIIIIVLTILAGITIAISMNTGLIDIAGKSKNDFDKASVKQILDSIFFSEKSKYNSGLITESDMLNNVKDEINSDERFKTVVKENNTVTVTTESNSIYDITLDGIVKREN